METGQSYLEVYCAMEMRSHYWTALVTVLEITIAAVILKLLVLSVQMVSKNCPTCVSSSVSGRCGKHTPTEPDGLQTGVQCSRHAPKHN